MPRTLSAALSQLNTDGLVLVYLLQFGRKPVVEAENVCIDSHARVLLRSLIPRHIRLRTFEPDGKRLRDISTWDSGWLSVTSTRRGKPDRRTYFFSPFKWIYANGPQCRWCVRNAYECGPVECGKADHPTNLLDVRPDSALINELGSILKWFCLNGRFEPIAQEVVTEIHATGTS